MVLVDGNVSVMDGRLWYQLGRLWKLKKKKQEKEKEMDSVSAQKCTNKPFCALS